MAHTPGPWAWFGVELLSTAGFVLDTKKDGRPNSADASLIAAAPDLLATLKDTSDALAQFVDTGAKIRKPYEHPLSAYDRARAAIAKAEGAQK